jgi:hypothetical protein
MENFWEVFASTQVISNLLSLTLLKTGTKDKKALAHITIHCVPWN